MKKFWQRYRFALPDNSEYSMMLQKGSESFILPLNKKHKKDSYFISIAIGYLIGFFLPKCGYWHQHACCRHVHDGVANQDASIGITNSLTTSGNLRGVRLRMVNSDFLISNQENTGQINLSTNFNTRMTIEASGKVGINTIASTMSLHVTALNKYGIYSTATENGTDTIAGIFNKALSPAPVPYSAGVRGESNSTDQNGIGVLGVHTGFGWGVAGFVKELGSFTYGSGVYGAAGSPLSGFGNGGYGVQGVNNNINGVAGFFQNNSGSGGSRALVTYGAVQLINLNEGAGKVLTSDIAGNATWQNLPGGAGAWTMSGNDISNTNTGKVGIGTNTFDAFNKMQILFSSGLSEYITVQSTVANKSMGFNLKNPDGQWIFGQNIGNYPDSRFNFFYTPTVGATSQLLTLTKEGNLGIGDYTGLGVAPTERLEIKNGFLKVSGTNRTAFTVTATATNTSGNNTLIDYINPISTDVIIVTHNWQGNYMGSIGVYFTAGTWRLFREDQVAIPIGEKFNVMIIK